MEEENKKNYLSVCIFNIYPCVFTQISIERARWMRNLIPHPTSTHAAYFWQTPLPQKQEIPKKTWWWPCYPQNKKYLKKCDDDVIITFFQVFIVFGVAGSIKSMQCGTRWMRNQILHPTSSLDRNLSKNTMRYVENTNTKVVFFFLPPKLINIILLFYYFNYYFIIFLRRPIFSWNFL